jgi:signal transduction histidine kinase
VDIGWALKEDGVCLYAADTGIGIPEEDLPLLLEPFTQRDSNLTRAYEGTGLGLPLTKHLVEMHGGRLDVETAKSVGTTVTAILPKHRIVDLDGGVAVAQGNDWYRFVSGLAGKRSA